MHTSAIKRLSIILALTLCVTSCGLTDQQKQATAKFADAATKFGQTTSDELIKMRDQTVAMNVALYRVPDLKSKDEDVECQKKSGEKESEPRKPIAIYNIEKGKYENPAGDFSGKWYETFISGPQAMKAYGIALTDILNADNKEQVKKSSDALAAALKAIPGSPAGNASADAISALAQQLTEMYLESMKAHAIKSIVESTKDAVPAICNQVRENFTASGDNFEFRFQDTAIILSSASETAMWQNCRDRVARSDSLNGYLLAKPNLDEVDNVFPAIAQSSAACVKANAAVIGALQNTSYDMNDIKGFFNAAQTLRTNISDVTKGK